MDGLTPEQVQQLILLMTQNEQQDHLASQTGVSNDILRAPHHSLLGGILGGASSGLGNYMQMKNRDRRADLNERLLRAMQGSGSDYYEGGGRGLMEGAAFD